MNGFASVPALKRAVAEKIRAYVEGGGFLFAMCSATETLDLALAAGPDVKAEDRVDRIQAAAKLAAAVRDQLKQVADWNSPPKLSAEDETAVKKLIAELSSADFQAREAASKALAAKGRAVRALLEAELKASGDFEVKNRAEQILEGLRPPALRLELVAGLVPVLATE